ncbi:MAG: pilus assembly protein PilM, partial [Thermodesulfovibrionales bacterium]|nr:pilus assembly protein PilM [Thermodesulfovibrionales bacterium]
IIEDKGAASQALTELLQKNKIKSTNAIISVSGHSSVIIKRITIPKMKEEDLSNSIKFEAEQYIPFDINDVNIDFQILGDTHEGSDQMDVILIAVKKSVVKDYLDVVENAGLVPVLVDLPHFAMSNIFEHSYGLFENETIALINIGANSTNINIIRNGMPLFTRDTPIGSIVHSEALMQEYNVTIQDAERLKKGLSVEDVPPENATYTIISSSEEIFSDIQRSMDFFRSSVSEEDIVKVFLSGSVAMTKGFASAMAERLLVPVEPINPFNNLKISEKLDSNIINEYAPLGVVAIGLSLRRPGDR